MHDLEIYCKNSTILYIHEGHLDVSYFNNKVSERRKPNEKIIDTLCRLLNKRKDMHNFLNVFKDLSVMVQDIEQKERKRLILEGFCVKTIDL